MNDRERNFVRMEGTVIDVLQPEIQPGKTTFAAIPILTTAIESLISGANLIGALDARQSGRRDGVLGGKKDATRLLLDLTMIVAGAVRAFATITGDIVLKDQMTFSRSSLAELPDEAIDDKAQVIHDTATTHLAALTANYGINAARLTSLQDRITAYGLAVNSPRGATIDISSIVGLIDAQILKDRDLLENVIDPLMLQLAESNPALYARYKAARIIVDINTGKPEKPEATPVNS